MVVLEAQGKLLPGQKFVNESVLGNLHYSRVILTIKEGGFHGIIPYVKGSAWMTTISQLSCDPTDALGLGFLIRGRNVVM